MPKPGPNAPNVAIIGAGWAGMAAAVTLAQNGVLANVFESAKTLGGRARTVTLDTFSVDNGQHILLGAYRDTLALIDAVNERAAAQLSRLPLALTLPPDFDLRAPRLPAPWHLVAGLLTARGLRIADRLRAMQMLVALRQLNFCLPRDITVSELLALHRQTENLRRFLWHPLCLAALNTPPEEASAQVFLNVLRDSFSQARADSDLVLPCVNLSQLFPEPAAAFVEGFGGSVRTNSRVDGLACDNGTWLLKVGEETNRATHVICTAPPLRSAELIEHLPGMAPIAESLRALQYQPIYTVYLQYPSDTRLNAPMLGLQHGLGQWVFDRGQLGGPAGLLAVVISASGTHEALDHATLAEEVTSQLAAALRLRTAPSWHQVIAEKRATFSCTPALSRPPSHTPLTGLYLAGDHVAGDYPATIEGAVRSGVKCARLILESQ